MNWLSIRTAGIALLLGPASGGVYQLLGGFNWVVFCVSLVFLTFSLCLIVLGHLGHKYSDRGMELLSSEDAVQHKIYELLEHKNIKSIDFISAGVSSRKNMFLRLAKELRLPYRVMAQDPQNAISNKERISTIKALYDMATDMGQEKWNSPDVKFQFYDDHASLRAAIFRDDNGAPVYAIIGWYIYHDKNTSLSGSRHPSIYINDKSNALLKFANEQFTRKWTNENILNYQKVLELNHLVD
jgi:hypothetical protein